MNDNAHATLINAQKIIGDIKPGMSVSEQKRVLHETTVIENSNVKSNSNLICQKCKCGITCIIQSLWQMWKSSK